MFIPIRSSLQSSTLVETKAWTNFSPSVNANSEEGGSEDWPLEDTMGEGGRGWQQEYVVIKAFKSCSDLNQWAGMVSQHWLTSEGHWWPWPEQFLCWDQGENQFTFFIHFAWWWSWSWAASTFSSTFERNGINGWLAFTSRSRLGFLKSAWMAAVFRAHGMWPVWREQFMIFVIVGSCQRRGFLSKLRVSSPGHRYRVCLPYDALNLKLRFCHPAMVLFTSPSRHTKAWLEWVYL